MANNFEDNPQQEKTSLMDDELDGFHKAVKQKLKDFICFSSPISPTGVSNESVEFASTKTALNATASNTKTVINATVAGAKKVLNTSAPSAEISKITLQVSDDENDIYKFTNPKRGLAVIINNENFSSTKDFSDRPGSSFDASALDDTFRRLGFEVMLENNLTAKQMTLLLTLVSKKYDHINADCFVCVVLSHGDETWITREFNKTRSTERHDLLFGVDGKAVASKVVVETFNDDNCPSLKGKPRLFFFQACRGTKLDDGTDIRVTKDQAANSKNNETSSSSLHEKAGSLMHKTQSKVEKNRGENDLNDDLPWSYVHDIPVSPAPLYKDCLIMYATPPGYYAWRRKNGAWFVQSLCVVLKNSGLSSMSFVKALVLVNKYVACNYHSDNKANPKMDAKKEMPVIQSMLVKDIFMTARRK